MVTRQQISYNYIALRRSHISDKQAIAEYLIDPLRLPVDLQPSDVADLGAARQTELLEAAATGGAKVADRAEAEAILRRIVGLRPVGRPKSERKVPVEILLDRDLFDALTAAAQNAGIPRARYIRDILSAAVKILKKQ